MFMQDEDVLNDKGGIGLHPIYAITPSTDTKQGKPPITKQEFIHKQGRNWYCCKVSYSGELPGSMFNQYRTGYLVCTAPIYMAVQISVYMFLQPCLLYHLHYPTLAPHLSARRMYSEMRSEYYWSHITNDIYTTVRNFANTSERYGQRNDDAPYNYFPQVTHWSLSQWISWDRLQRH